MIIDLSSNSKTIPACPICQRMGQKVRKETVEHQVNQGIKVLGEQFFLCRTPECKVAYYSQDEKKPIFQDQLHNKIWFKKVPPPVPICYCANVTEEEILYHVAVAKCCSTLEDIKKHTGANTGCECLTKNPAGG
ncbi:(2Fe-2S)-binding protein [Desulfosporosinus sp. SB140]|uniref:(2Fe-2S)-binding protein n=1 Tax=Desulfosporosinus paludis TaxID=3115649 RepID=UPI00388FBBB8